MPNNTVPAADAGLPDEPTFEVTEVGRMYLLIQSIIDRLHIQGRFASFEITSEMADDLAVFGVEREDVEDDDPSEEDLPAEDREQLESDSRDEPYKPVEQRPVRRISSEPS